MSQLSLPPPARRLSRGGMLLLCALFIGGIGCAYNTYDAAAARRNAEAQLARLEAQAASNDPSALVAAGMTYYHGGLIPPDRPRAMAYLERAAATGSPLGQAQLGRLLVINSPIASADRARGLLLLAAAARQGCNIPSSYGPALFPYTDLANLQIAQNPEQADLWRARGMLYCGTPPILRSAGQPNNTTPQERATGAAGWLLLERASATCNLVAQMQPLADCDAARRRAEALRERVRATEAEAPPPPRPTPKPLPATR